MSNPARFLPYGRQYIDDADIEAVVKVLRGDWLTTGPTVGKFESALAERVGARYAVACASGTAALHLTALALNLGAGDAIIVPAMTFLATANVARFVGAEVVFADVDPETGLTTVEHVEAALAKAAGVSVKAIYPVHLNGQCADPVQIGRLAAQRGLAVVEDACHALGGAYRAASGALATVGSCQHSDMAVFSFHPVKTLTSGEGGAVTTNRSDLQERLARFRSHGIIRDEARFENEALARDRGGKPNPWYYEMPEVGYNYRINDIQCALGLSQLAKLDLFMARRRELAVRYDAALAPLAPVVRPLTRTRDDAPVLHLYPVKVDFKAVGMTRAQLMSELARRGIGTQVHYIPLHFQPYYRRRYGPQCLPGAEAYYNSVLSLPFFFGMSDADVDRVVEALRDLLS